MKQNKILAISSQGGHWVQLKRLIPAFKDHHLILISTFTSQPSLPENCTNYYSVMDASRWNKIKLVQQAFQVLRIILIERPDKIVSTGASVGLWAILSGRLIGAKTVWIDSIANAEEISLSGRIAKPFTHIHLTQWEHLKGGKSIYRGAVI